MNPLTFNKEKHFCLVGEFQKHFDKTSVLFLIIFFVT